jgi:adenosylcobinamide-GDP ribazoletransferase
MSDNLEPQSAAPYRFRPFTEVLVSLRFLTVLPIPFVRRLDPPPLNVAMGMFPVAGAAIGAMTGLLLVIGKLAGLPEYFSAAMALGVTLLVTGALHEDGLADVADGFGGGHSREQCLDIMHDSQIGTYGALALCVAMLGKASLYASLIDFPPGTIIVLLASAGAFSRALIVDLMWATRPARSEGLSVMAGRPSRNTTLLALGIGGLGAGIAASYVLAPGAGILALIAGGVALALVRSLAMRKIGGQTGDVIGASQVLAEIAMLAVYSATISLP